MLHVVGSVSPTWCTWLSYWVSISEMSFSLVSFDASLSFPLICLLDFVSLNHTLLDGQWFSASGAKQFVVRYLETLFWKLLQAFRWGN